MAARVQTGLDRLLAHSRRLLRRRRTGLVASPSAVTHDLLGAAEALLARGVRLVALFGPEHGLDGSALDGMPVADGTDRRTGLPVYSLYGQAHEPGPEALAGLEILLFDSQDVGARFYTFFSTLYRVLEAAARHGLEVLVLDRPNPLTGVAMEGPLLEPQLRSFVGLLPVPVRHGLTLGELALMACAHDRIRARISVLKMAGWRRTLWFDETGLPWVPPSPAMPHLSTATLYPGTCLIEGTNLSEGRGTALPFEVCGAPWLDGHDLALALNGLNLAGVRFRPVRFVPAASKHAGKVCGGVQVHVTDRVALQPVRVGVEIIAAAREQAPERTRFLPGTDGGPPYFDLLAGTASLRLGLEAGTPVQELVAGWAAGLAEYARLRQAHLLYE